MSDLIYLGYNATTPLLPQVVEAMLPYLNRYSGNPLRGINRLVKYDVLTHPYVDDQLEIWASNSSARRDTRVPYGPPVRDTDGLGVVDPSDGDLLSDWC